MSSRALALVVLVLFAALNVITAVTEGPKAAWDAVVGARGWSLVFLVDLVIALTLACVWMWRDARARGRSPLPFVALAAAMGSVGPLAYLVTRGRRPS